MSYGGSFFQSRRFSAFSLTSFPHNCELHQNPPFITLSAVSPESRHFRQVLHCRFALPFRFPVLSNKIPQMSSWNFILPKRLARIQMMGSDQSNMSAWHADIVAANLHRTTIKLSPNQRNYGFVRRSLTLAILICFPQSRMKDRGREDDIEFALQFVQDI